MKGSSSGPFKGKRDFFLGIAIKIILFLILVFTVYLFGLLACIGGLTTQPLLVKVVLRGLFLGSIYGLIALGYTMVYGILKFINFAHGEIFMVGAVTSFVLVLNYSMNFILACIVSMIFCGFLGALIEKLAYRPLRYSSRLTPLITAIGISLLLQSIIQITFGPDQKGFMAIGERFEGVRSFIEKQYTVGMMGNTPITIQTLDLLILSVAIIVMISLHLFITYTKMGKAIRATADDFETASTIGINIDRVITATFVVGSMLAALGGIFYGLKFVIEFNMGVLPGIKAFTAAVVGGIGNIYGAMLGGLIIGMSEKVGGLLISTDLETAIVFIVLIIFLIFKPTGLLGKKEGGPVRDLWKRRYKQVKQWLRGAQDSKRKKRG